MSARARPQCRQAGCEAGFSLLELIVSIGLLALILATMPAALRLGGRALNVAESVDQDFAKHVALEFVAQRLTQAISIYDRRADGRLRIMFRGEDKSISFVAPATLGSAGGLYWFELKARTGAAETLDVILSWSEFRASRAESQSAPVQFDRLLLGDVQHFNLRYYGAATVRAEPGWADTWTSNDTLPEIVEIRITGHSAGQTTSKTVRVPLRLRPSR